MSDEAKQFEDRACECLESLSAIIREMSNKLTAERKTRELAEARVYYLQEQGLKTASVVSSAFGDCVIVDDEQLRGLIERIIAERDAAKVLEMQADLEIKELETESGNLRDVIATERERADGIWRANGELHENMSKRLAQAEQRAESYLDEILIALAGLGIGTPETTYKHDGGIGLAISDIRRAV